MTTATKPTGRKMEWYGSTFTVYEHVILKNLWEYYVLDCKKGDIRECLVMGFETEMGDVSMSEIAPYVILRTTVTKDTEIKPVTGGKWLE